MLSVMQLLLILMFPCHYMIAHTFQAHTGTNYSKQYITDEENERERKENLQLDVNLKMYSKYYYWNYCKYTWVRKKKTV